MCPPDITVAILVSRLTVDTRAEQEGPNQTKHLLFTTRVATHPLKNTIVL